MANLELPLKPPFRNPLGARRITARSAAQNPDTSITNPNLSGKVDFNPQGADSVRIPPPRTLPSTAPEVIKAADWMIADERPIVFY